MKMSSSPEGTVTANGGKSNSDSHGIRADSVSVIGGTVNANGGVTTGSSCGIYAGSVEVTGGYIYANDSGSATVTATSGSSYGIYSMGSVTIGDPDTYTGEVNAYGAQANRRGQRQLWHLCQRQRRHERLCQRNGHWRRGR